MEAINPFARIQRFCWVSLLVLALMFSGSCTTTYDTYGRPVKSVEPGVAIAGVAAALVVGALIASSSNQDDEPSYYDDGYQSYHNDGYQPYYGRSRGYQCR